ncbi:MAG: hypothetical protein LBP59_17130 [Planctomycetaceae bacterium]|nr:hypothetical protein [Planctomycetaceae bacterium]
MKDRGRLACISRSRASRLHFRIVGVPPTFQDRGRLACMRLYSTANERGLTSQQFFFCLAANCRRPACVPS